MNHKKIIIHLLLITALIPFSLAEEVHLYLFYGQGCPHCARAIAFLDEISEKYPETNVVSYEIYFNDENRELFMHYCSELDQSAQGVPTIFIDEKTFIGFNNNIAQQIEEEVKRCLTGGCEDVAEKCTLKGHVRGDFDPVNPMSNSYYSLVGWIFIIVLSIIIISIITKKIKNK